MDVDVYTGALAEPPMEGAIIGPLLSCLITDQFMRIKLGDSFWYERPVGPQAFTKGKGFILCIFCDCFTKLKIPVAQLHQIYDTSLAAIICRNSDAVNQSPREVMRKVSPKNPVVICSQLDTFSFIPWREDPMMDPLTHVPLGEPVIQVRTTSNVSTTTPSTTN